MTTAINSDSQSLSLTLGELFSSLFTGTFTKIDEAIQQHEVDTTMRNEFSDLLSPTCNYEELPKSFPATETGFDITYNLMFQEKVFDVVDVLVEEDSVLKVFANVPNPKNNVNIFLYDKADMKNLIVYTLPQHSEKEFTAVLKAQRKPFKLKIVYDSLDESDNCPTFQLRVGLKPIRLVASDNL